MCAREQNTRLTSVAEPSLRLALCRIPISVALLLLFLSAKNMAPTVEADAQTQYTIPVNWQLPPGQVNIAVPATPEWAHDAVLDALRIWNEAQLWVKEKIFKTGEVYMFSESASGTEVRFVYRDQSGCGAVLDTPKGRVISLRLMDSFNKTISPVVVTSCAAHELGHILGVGHTSVHLDLMSGLVIPAAPSTLDLYAVHLLAGGLKERTIVTLPSDITYARAPVPITSSTTTPIQSLTPKPAPAATDTTTSTPAVNLTPSQRTTNALPTMSVPTLDANTSVILGVMVFVMVLSAGVFLIRRKS